PFKHEMADTVAIDRYGVIDTGNSGKRRSRRHECGMHALHDAAFALLGNGEQLHPETELRRKGDVRRADLVDTFDMHIVEIDFRTEGEARKNGKLVRRVYSTDIAGRVGLGIAKRLRVLQHVAKVAARRVHLGEDVIAGTVQNAVDAADLVACQRL